MLIGDNKMIEKWKFIVSLNKRYADFTILDEPYRRFDDIFANQDFQCVQIHSTELLSDAADIVGFCGAFSWENGILTPLDGDTYAQDMAVLGFNSFLNKKGEKCLDILVG